MAYQGNNQNRSGGFNNNRPNGNQGQQRSGGFDKPKFDMPLELNYNEDENLFDTTAQKWAEAISGTKKTQARNFYDKVLELEQKAQNEAWSNVLPFVKMLNSKVAYGVSRKVVTIEFQTMLNKCIEQVKTVDDLKVFKLFFEAVLGFFKGRD